MQIEGLFCSNEHPLQKLSISKINIRYSSFNIQGGHYHKGRAIRTRTNCAIKYKTNNLRHSEGGTTEGIC